MRFGEKLVKLARASILGLDFPEDFPEETQRVFVCVYSFPEKELRGCIGFVEDFYLLKDAVSKAAKLAAFEDQRFLPLDVFNEKFVVEVSVLSEPELLEGDYLSKIKIGDGLIVEYGDSVGLLLPKVAVEYGFSVVEFLENCCLKAGLSKDKWKDKDCKVYVFKAEVFSELEPDGEVEKG